MATDAAPSKADIVYLLGNRDDPDVDSAVRAYMREAYANERGAPEKPEEALELTGKVQRKYIAAQVVEHGIQNISVPLSADSTAPVKRYVQELLRLNRKAGFEDPMTEVEKRLYEKAATVETAKDLLAAVQPYASPDFHAALTESLAAVERELNTTVVLDGSSAPYKKWADRIRDVCDVHGLPWQLLLAAKKPAGLSEEARHKVGREYAEWVQSARVADAQAEIDALRADATALLDRQLSKSAEQIRKEQAAAMAALQKKIEAARGTEWAKQYQKDLDALAQYDAQVAADPVNGPKVSATA